MRILQVMSTLNVGCGIANFVMNYCRKISKDGVCFDFLLFHPMPISFSDEVQKLGGRIFYIEKPTLNFGKYDKQVKRFFCEHRGEWDLVHIHEILLQRFVIKNAKKYGGVKKIVTHSHAARFVLPTYGVSAVKNALKMFVKRCRNKFLLSKIEKNSDCCLACSEAAGVALYGKAILQSDKFHVIKNAIDVKKYQYNPEIREEYRREYNLCEKKVIIQIGRLCEQKNQIFFLDVMHNLVQKDNSYVLLLVGDGPMHQEVERKIKELELNNNVMIMGNRTDVAKLLQCADLSVLPSLTEGLGIVLIEAQASGLPCIASSGVPQEANVTPYVQFLNLDDGVQAWADAIKNTQIQRYDTKTLITDSGYDINESVARLADIYLTLSRTSN